MEITVLSEFSNVNKSYTQELYFLVKLDIPTIQVGKERVPVHLALVLDRSGSMAGEKLELTKQAACYFINWLTRNDNLAVVIYDENVEILVSHQLLTDKKSVEEQIRRIVPGGSTNLSGGWLKGLSQIKEHKVAGHLNRVLLMTDGKANVGIVEPEELYMIAAKHLEKGISTTTLGFGADFNEDLLKRISDYGGGRFYSVQEPELLAESFKKEFGELARVVGQNLEINLKCAEGVSIGDVLSQFPGKHSENEIICRLGDVRADDLKQFIFSLRIPSEYADNEAVVASLDVRYDSVIGDMDTFYSQIPIHINFTSKQLKQQANEEVRREVWMAQSARVKLQAIELADQGDTSQASTIIYNHIQLIGKAGVPTERVKQEKTRLEELALLLSKGDYGLSTRKKITDEAYIYREQRGVYQQTSGFKTIDKELHPNEELKLLDISAEIRKLMLANGFEKEKIDSAELALRELVTNAFEHGCKGKDDQIVTINCYISSEYIKIVVKDAGPGFDFEETLKQVRKDKNLRKIRGRGILLVEGCTDHFRYSDQGRCAEAIILRESAIIDTSLADSHTLQYEQDIVILKISNPIVSPFHYKLEKILYELIRKGWLRIVVDFSELPYISSVGLGMLITFADHITHRDGKLVLANIPSKIMSLFQTVGFTSIFKIFGSVKEAVEYLRIN